MPLGQPFSTLPGDVLKTQCIVSKSEVTKFSQKAAPRAPIPDPSSGLLLDPVPEVGVAVEVGVWLLRS